MSDNLTDNAESRVLNWLTLNSTTAPTTGLSLRLMTANGSDSAAGTEVTGGSYTAQDIAFGSSSGGAAATNSGDVTFASMPACTVVGFEIWDKNGTPFRWWYGAATASKVVNSGDTYKVSAGALSLALA